MTPHAAGQLFAIVALLYGIAGLMAVVVSLWSQFSERNRIKRIMKGLE